MKKEPSEKKMRECLNKFQKRIEENLKYIYVYDRECIDFLDNYDIIRGEWK